MLWEVWQPWNSWNPWKNVIFVPGAWVSAWEPGLGLLSVAFEEDFSKQADASGEWVYIGIWGDGGEGEFTWGERCCRQSVSAAPTFYLPSTHLQLMLPIFWLGKEKQEGFESLLPCTLSKFLGSLQHSGLPKPQITPLETVSTVLAPVISSVPSKCTKVWRLMAASELVSRSTFYSPTNLAASRRRQRALRGCH